jgi:hypothetical protein
VVTLPTGAIALTGVRSRPHGRRRADFDRLAQLVAVRTDGVEAADVRDVVATGAVCAALHNLHAADVAGSLALAPISREQAELDPAKPSVHLV